MHASDLTGPTGPAGPTILRIALAAMLFVAALPRPAAAQQSISEVLSFLFTNRSVSTGDLTYDIQAAAATRDAISSFLIAELGSLPISSSAGGFTYRLNPALGSSVRSSESFGPFFIERSLTAGRRQASFGVSYQHTAFDSIDGRSLRDGTLVATATRLAGNFQPFDVETVALRIDTNTVTLWGNVGLADRLDVGAAIPFVTLSLSGQRIDTYRSSPFIQATASAAASGIGDIVVRAKYNVRREMESGLAIGAEARLPTGSEQNLLGAGRATIKPRLIASVERNRTAVTGDLGYVFGGPSRGVEFGGAVTVVAAPRLTAIAEIVGRRLASFGRLTSTVEPHPVLAGVETIRLIGVQQPSTRIVAVMGFKWNVARTWLLNANVRRSMTASGLNAGWVPTLTLDFSFRR